MPTGEGVEPVKQEDQRLLGLKVGVVMILVVGVSLIVGFGLGLQVGGC